MKISARGNFSTPWMQSARKTVIFWTLALQDELGRLESEAEARVAYEETIEGFCSNDYALSTRLTDATDDGGLLVLFLAEFRREVCCE